MSHNSRAAGRAKRPAIVRHTGRSRAWINSFVIVPPSLSPSRIPHTLGPTRLILGHACSHTTHKRCIQANPLVSGRRYLAAVALRRLATLDRHRPCEPLTRVTVMVRDVKRFTFYRVSAKRGSLLPKLTGIVVMTGVLHALCNAHHLRELKALVGIEKEHWARRMQRLLRRACHAMNLARERGVPLSSGLIALIERRYNAILAEGHEVQPALAIPRRRGRPPRRVGHHLLLRLSIRKQDVLRFLTDPRVPFTNNLVEQDGRMMKLRQKISGGFRSQYGAKDFAIIRSVLSTARKQGWDIIQTLTATPACLITDIRLA